MTDLVQVQEVPFFGGAIEAVRRNGRNYVSVRRCCEDIGVDFSGQLQKLKTYKWSELVDFSTVAEDGKQRVLTLIPSDKVPMWMANINVNKVDPRVASRIERYQEDAARVLAAHFLGAGEVEEKFRLESDVRRKVREKGKDERKGFTSFLARKGCQGRDYADVTNAGYRAHLGGTAKEIRRRRGLKDDANLREHMSAQELGVTYFYENATQILGEQRDICDVSSLCLLNANNAAAYAKAIADVGKLIGLH